MTCDRQLKDCGDGPLWKFGRLLLCRKCWRAQLDAFCEQAKKEWVKR